MNRLSSILFTILASLCLPFMASALDQNTNLQSDIWEVRYGAQNLSAVADPDHDGYSNALESIAGTNPLDPTSYPKLNIGPGGSPGALNLGWVSEPGKSYGIYGSPDLNPANFTLIDTVMGDGTALFEALTTNGQPRWFFKLQAIDVDSDLDGLTNWEEAMIGFNPLLDHSDRNDTADLVRVQNTLNAASTITVGLVDGAMREDWPDRGVIAIRRSGGLKPLWINLSFTGSATRSTDYSTSNIGLQVYLPFGARETWVELTPINDASVEGDESITVTATTGAGYSLGTLTSATAVLSDASSLPSAKASARFLIQSAFGPDQDSAADGDDIPENVETLMTMGFDAWIEDQFNRPIGYIQPYVNWALANANALQLYGNYKEHAWWSRAMGAPKLRPDAVTTQLPDPLRQRVAFALSEILVTSDRPESLAVDFEGMANYYDLLEQHAFGNYRDLLKAVALHPVMGVYLSHLGNQKANPALKIHPDENFAREIMQLFSIGLWELNTNGARKLDGQGHFIPTYSNSDITELARVFTGLTWGNSTGFSPNNLTNGDRLQPMKVWDDYHDCDSKILLGGLSLPARVASSGSTGTAGLADIDAAVGNLFNHPNVGPFLALRLIQRFVTSNPSPDYIERVALKFNNNGSGVRGDMKAVIKAILMDPEARNPVMMDSPTWGKLREPVLRVVNLARAFNAASTSGYYPLDQFALDHLQDPQNAPSVFNFFLPNHSPPGPITQMGLVAPEFQILNASSAITGANYFFNAIGDNSLHRWGNGTPAYVVRLNLDPELSMIVPAASISLDTPDVAQILDTDTLIRRLDMALLGGTMSPQLFQNIREAIDRVKPPDQSWEWHRQRLRLLITLIVTSAEFNVLR
ncbi:hypothetical protein BH11VER1_BH11VER1_37020 [soil metagenome]